MHSALSLWLITAARAQEATSGEIPAINAQTFRPSVDAPTLLWADDATRLPSGTLTGRMLFSYANDPLVYTFSTGERVELISNLLQVDLLGGYTFGPGIRLGVDLPLYFSAGDSGAPGESGLGDVGGDLKIALLDPMRMPLGLALSGKVGLPTSTGAAPVGWDGTSWEGGLIVDKPLGRAALLAANLGTRVVPGQALENLTWDDQLFARAGGSYALSDAAGLSLEGSTYLAYGEWDNIDALPIEALLGGWTRPGRGDLVLRGGVGTGLSTGVGAPKLRAVLSVGREPPAGEDLDGDGLVTGFDACPQRAEDRDRYEDNDGCPDPTTVALRFVDPAGNPVPGVRFAVGPHSGDGAASEKAIDSGTYAVTAEAPDFHAVKAMLTVPGGERSEVQYVMQPVLPGRIVVHVLDPSGVPIPNARWFLNGREKGDVQSTPQASAKPGIYTIAASAEGYLRASEQARVREDVSTEVELVLKPTTTRVTRERIELGDSIYFETGKAIIKPESYTLLEDVASILREYPEIRKVRIEGHTDSRGSAADNYRLSDARAAALVSFLVERGISGERLTSVGYGESRPLDRRENQAAWAKNRRVDFFVEEWVDLPVETPAPAPEPAPAETSPETPRIPEPGPLAPESPVPLSE